MPSEGLLLQRPGFDARFDRYFDFFFYPGRTRDLPCLKQAAGEFAVSDLTCDRLGVPLLEPAAPG